MPPYVAMLIVILLSAGCLTIVAIQLFMPPPFPDPRKYVDGMRSNEQTAADAMRTISTAEVAFQTAGHIDNDRDGIGDFGTLEQLANPAGDGSVPGYIDSELVAGSKNGYTFTSSVNFGSEKAPPSYNVIAVPIVPGASGIRQYHVDQSGVVRFTADGTAVTPGSPPLN